MRRFLPHTASILGLFSALVIFPVAAQNRQAPKLPTNLPPSADLKYAIQARQNGIPIEGNANVRWIASSNSFTVSNEVRAILAGKILDVKSEGIIDAYGLAPLRFTEKRFRKAPTTTSFDRKANLIHFTGTTQTYPIQGGEQDRSSAIWQLISMARATPTKPKPGMEWRFFVAGTRDGEPWVFKVIKPEKIRTRQTEWNTLHIVRERPHGSKGQQLDVWLAPTMEWYPVRLRFSDENGDFIEQTLMEVNHNSY